ncbi:MAG: hypothetical protein K2N03_07125, partial [Muribaculaceae bacterium]|nr:hypothetical protein [Muribaculaceae bacterium]
MFFFTKSLITDTLRKVSLLIGVILLLCACSSEEDQRPVASADRMDIAIRIRLNSAENSTMEASSATTRAQSYSFEDPVDIHESMITSLRVIIVRTDKDNAVEINDYYDLEQYKHSLDPNGYLHFTIIPDENKRIFFIANESSLPMEIQKVLTETFLGVPLPKGFFDLKWSVERPGVLIDNEHNSPQYIPMTEFFDFYADSKNVDSVDEEGIGTIVKDYFITRAATKFRFTIEDGYGGRPVGPGFRIKALHFSRIASEEYIFPHETVYSPGKYEESAEYNGGRAITSFIAPATAEKWNYSFYPEQFGWAGVLDWTSSFGTLRRTWSPLIYFPETLLDKENGFSIGAEIEFDTLD